MTIICYHVLCFVSILLWKFTYCQQYIGDLCTLQRTKETGQCQLIENCPIAIHNFHSFGLYPQNCGFRGRSPIVCCTGNITNTVAGSDCQNPSAKNPISNFIEENPEVGRKSRQKCEEYGQQVFVTSTINTLTGLQYNEQCPFPSVELVIRNVAKPREFPHMAAIGYDDENEKVWKCSGSLISENFVLTAGSCLSHPQYGSPKYIRLGDLDLYSDTDDAMPQEFNIIERIAHPKYKPPSQYHDIALLKMDRAAQFSAYVKPACLNTSPTLTTTQAVVSEWGKNSSDRSLSMATLKYTAYSECSSSYSSQEGLDKGIVEASQVCAGASEECQENDFGGPLQIYNNLEVSCTYKIVGVTSFPKLCGDVNKPGVYTKVSKHIKWIERQVWP